MVPIAGDDAADDRSSRDAWHDPVLARECMELLEPEKRLLWFDGTLGDGGHAILALGRNDRLVVEATDADPTMVERARRRFDRLGLGDRIDISCRWYDDVLCATGPEPDVIFLDLGISRFHFAEAGRGFSFRDQTELDMRLSPDSTSSAADLVNDASADDLADMFFHLGGERDSRRYARAVVAARSDEPITTAAQLAEVIRRATPVKRRHGRVHPATRVFQALRISVNRELDRLQAALACIRNSIAPGGKVGIISFHSLEDRLVKQAFRAWAYPERYPTDDATAQPADDRRFALVTRKPVAPDEGETARNPLSRSAKLRVVERVA